MTSYLTKIIFLLLLLLLIGNSAISQEKIAPEQVRAFQLLDSLWENPTSFFNINDSNWRELCANLDHIDLDDLNNVSHSIFYGQDAKILNNTNASKGALGSMNSRAQKKKEKEFTKNNFVQTNIGFVKYNFLINLFINNYKNLNK